jgi:formylmethanofuran dehydrogenase subunit E
MEMIDDYYLEPIDDYHRLIMDTYDVMDTLYENKYSNFFEALKAIERKYDEIKPIFEAADEICKKCDEMGLNQKQVPYRGPHDTGLQ